MKFLYLSFVLLFWAQSLAQLKIRDIAPIQDHEMLSIDGQNLSLNTCKKAKGLVVVFSCNSCPFVVGSDDFPGWEKQYDSLYQFASSKDLGFVLINSNEAKRNQADSYAEMKLHAEAQAYKMPYLMDAQSTLANAFGARTTPHVYFFDETFSLIYTGSIDNSWDNARKTTQNYLFDAMSAHVANKKIKPNATEPKGCGIKRVSIPAKN